MALSHKDHIKNILRHVNKRQPNEGEELVHWVERYAGQIERLFTGATKKTFKETCAVLVICAEIKLGKGSNSWLKESADKIISIFPVQEEEGSADAEEKADSVTSPGNSNEGSDKESDGNVEKESPTD